MPQIIRNGACSNSSIVLLGNSHRWALFHAWRTRDHADVVSGIMPREICMIYCAEPLCPSRAHSLVENEEYWGSAIGEAVNHTTVLSWLGNQANQFLFRAATQFSAYFGGESDGKQNLAELPYVASSMLEAFFEINLNYEGGRFADVLSRLSASKRVFVCGTPPPKPVGTILQNLKNEPSYYEAAVASGIEIVPDSVTPLPTRVALWRAQQAVFEKVCRSAMVEFVPVPIDACERDGSLKDIYSANDVTHANAAFGSLMWREVMRTLHV